MIPSRNILLKAMRSLMRGFGTLYSSSTTFACASISLLCYISKF